MNYAQLMYELVSLIGDLECYQLDDLAAELREAAVAIAQKGYARAEAQGELARLEAMWSRG